jgi:hypothetical protein
MGGVGLEMNKSIGVMLCLACLLSACTNPLPFGPGRVKVKLENAELVSVPESILFQRLLGSAHESAKRRDTIQFTFTSETDLLDYFRERIVQFRCNVDGARLRNQSNWGSGPYYEGTHLSLLPRDAVPETVEGAYHYSAYAFVDFAASEDVEGSSHFTPLDELQFTQLSCFIIGVDKAPVIFPRSNNLVLSHEAFLSKLRVFHSSGA